VLLRSNYDFAAGWQASFYPPLSMADLVLGQKADSSTPKVKKCKKMVQKVCILVHFCSKHVHFCKKNAKKCKKTLIFTLIFSSKTHKSYKITLFTTATHPNFQNFEIRNPLVVFFQSPIETCPPLARRSLPAIRVAGVAGPYGGIVNRKLKIPCGLDGDR
jgi:hypothetical protein